MGGFLHCENLQDSNQKIDVSFFEETDLVLRTYSIGKRRGFPQELPKEQALPNF